MPDYESRAVAAKVVLPERGEITGTAAEIAARMIVTRHMGASIPARSFLLGESDHSPIVQGVRDLCRLVILLLDDIENEEGISQQVVQEIQEMIGYDPA